MFTLDQLQDPDYLFKVLAELGLDPELIRLVAELSPLKGETIFVIQTSIVANESPLSVNPPQ